MILREGAGLGVHLITWCDTVNNLNRYFTHQILREFEMRVLFQMSPTDSGHMLDTPAASKLGAASRLLPQRGAKPAREVPALWRAVGRVDQECGRRPARTNAGVIPGQQCAASAMGAWITRDGNHR